MTVINQIICKNCSMFDVKVRFGVLPGITVTAGKGILVTSTLSIVVKIGCEAASSKFALIK